MKRILLFGFLLALFSSCGGSKLIVSEIRSLELEYSPGIDMNFGTRFEARIKAMMLNGDEIDVTSHRKMDFSSPDISKSGGTFTVVRRPMSFDEDKVAFSISVTDKEESYVQKDTLLMNFRGGISISSRGFDGENGINQKDRGSSWVFRDGKSGENGTNGNPGTPGGNLEARIWKEGDLYLMTVTDLNSLSIWRYKTVGTSPLYFDCSGGNGGRGGNGGNGSDGKDGEKDEDGKVKRSGNGGNGGDGGDGGNAGDGGMVRVVIHPSASGISGQLQYDLNGGSGGEGGRGGVAGKAGVALAGQAVSANGATGRQGRRGNAGQNGNSTLTIEEFDPETYKH